MPPSASFSRRDLLDTSLAVLALSLMLALPFGLLVTLFAYFRTFGAASPDLAASAATITGSLVMALRAVAVGQWLGLTGFLLALFVLLGRKYRDLWFFRLGRGIAFAWLPALGVGTVAGIFLLWYFHRHRAEFHAPPAAPVAAIPPPPVAGS